MKLTKREGGEQGKTRKSKGSLQLMKWEVKEGDREDVGKDFA